MLHVAGWSFKDCVPFGLWSKIFCCPTWSWNL